MSSINGGLQIGATALLASQGALQIIGNNVANASNPDYSREQPVVESLQGSTGQLGAGVQLTGVQRMADEAINTRLRGAVSDQSGTQSAADVFAQIETTFNTLGDNNLSSQMTAFFNAATQVANNPQDTASRTLLLQAGDSLSRAFNSADQSLQDQRTQINSQIDTLTAQANRLIGQVADLNGQITLAKAGSAGSSVANRADQRDAALTQLAQLANVQTVTAGNGDINVYLGSQVLVQGIQSSGLTAAADPNSAHGDQTVRLVGSKDAAPITGGQIGGLLTARSQGLDYAQDNLNQLAAGLIDEVNKIHSQGQGLTGAQSVTSAQAVSNPNAALNQAGLDLTPVTGVFNVLVTDPSGQTTTQTITVNLNGTGSDDSLNTLAGQISSGHVSAKVLPTGKLSITADAGYTVSFAQDSSNVLAALGVNTFFTGHSAADMAIRGDLTASGVAASLNQSPGDNSNALNLAALANQPIGTLGGVTLSANFAVTSSTVATRAAQTKFDQDSASTMVAALTSQQSAVSGVSIDQETINLMQFQQAYEGAAHYISVVHTLITNMINTL